MGGQQHTGGGRLGGQEARGGDRGATEGHLVGRRERYQGWTWVNESAELNHQSPTRIKCPSCLSTFQRGLNWLAGQTVCWQESYMEMRMKAGKALQMGRHNLCDEISASQARSDVTWNHAPTHRPLVSRAAPAVPPRTFALTSAAGQHEYHKIGQRSPIFSPADREMH